MERLVISKLQLQADYENMTILDICEKYGICLARLYKILDQCGIERKWDKAPKRKTKQIVIKD